MNEKIITSMNELIDSVNETREELKQIRVELEASRLQHQSFIRKLKLQKLLNDD